MNALDDFIRCLTALKNANFDFIEQDKIYRTGVIGQFNLTLKLAWEALQENLYAENESKEMIPLIRDSFIPALDALADTLQEKSKNLAE